MTEEYDIVSPRMEIEIYRTPRTIFRRSEWRWRAVDTRNGEPMAHGGEGYVDREDCEHAINRIKADFRDAPVVRGDDGR
jgi:uncharacterized protein YegP (UPF0339 family)